MRLVFPGEALSPDEAVLSSSVLSTFVNDLMYCGIQVDASFEIALCTCKLSCKGHSSFYWINLTCECASESCVGPLISPTPVFQHLFNTRCQIHYVFKVKGFSRGNLPLKAMSEHIIISTVWGYRLLTGFSLHLHNSSFNHASCNSPMPFWIEP